ncbi:uncharacterized protein EDB91DRAFT_1256426 [Suillus paluster]|uniref:uncharacterized protein n=1 Tax=Suillus paluster TaxID=48578 RepID=UPI001B863D07|nr:uncharacterized protein EDB91DRAFT_1256426 [Suillus paluster]KAG1721625.1 hypothetical protein EDB91DRAFT_1256426 [Suillus paluster]
MDQNTAQMGQMSFHHPNASISPNTSASSSQISPFFHHTFMSISTDTTPGYGDVNAGTAAERNVERRIDRGEQKRHIRKVKELKRRFIQSLQQQQCEPQPQTQPQPQFPVSHYPSKMYSPSNVAPWPTPNAGYETSNPVLDAGLAQDEWLTMTSVYVPPPAAYLHQQPSLAPNAGYETLNPVLDTSWAQDEQALSFSSLSPSAANTGWAPDGWPTTTPVYPVAYLPQQPMQPFQPHHVPIPPHAYCGYAPAPSGYESNTTLPSSNASWSYACACGGFITNMSANSTRDLCLQGQSVGSSGGSAQGGKCRAVDVNGMECKKQKHNPGLQPDFRQVPTPQGIKDQCQATACAGKMMQARGVRRNRDHQPSHSQLPCPDCGASRSDSLKRHVPGSKKCLTNQAKSQKVSALPYMTASASSATSTFVALPIVTVPQGPFTFHAGGPAISSVPQQIPPMPAPTPAPSSVTQQAPFVPTVQSGISPPPESSAPQQSTALPPFPVITEDFSITSAEEDEVNLFGLPAPSPLPVTAANFLITLAEEDHVDLLGLPVISTSLALPSVPHVDLDEPLDFDELAATLIALASNPSFDISVLNDWLQN